MHVDFPFENPLSKQATIVSIEALILERIQNKALGGTIKTAGEFKAT